MIFQQPFKTRNFITRSDIIWQFVPNIWSTKTKTSLSSVVVWHWWCAEEKVVIICTKLLQWLVVDADAFLEVVRGNVIDAFEDCKGYFVVDTMPNWQEVGLFQIWRYMAKLSNLFMSKQEPDARVGYK